MRLSQRDPVARAHVGRKRLFLLWRQLARVVTSVGTNSSIPRQLPTDQRLVDEGDAHPERRRGLPCSYTAIDRAQHSIPQVLRVALV